MFWGLIMEPNKRYTQVVEKPFHISQAAMDTSTGDGDPCQVMVVVDGKNFLICTLQKNKSIQVPLDLYFKTGDSVSFLTNGKCNVHLTGYLDPEFEDEEVEEEEEEDEEEAPALVPIKNKRKLDNSKEETTNKKAKVAKKADKKAAAADSSDSDDDNDKNALQKILDGEDMDTDEEDESFKVNTSAEGDSDEEESDNEEEEDEDDQEEAEEASSEEAETTLDTSKEEEAKTDMSKLTKSQKRRLKKKLAQQAKEQPQVNGVDKTKKDKPESKVEKGEKKKPEVKKDAQEPAEKKEKKSLTGGVSIEDTKVGSGPVAKPGKVVMVYYEGRLKTNNKMFDNCMKGPGFKFRLGAKEVISGWDVGINGMKVGGKRRIICPPNMAYGAKGSPPVIPPNSTLVFDVELKNVK